MIGPPRWVTPYLDIPYVDQGYGFDGCHCWGLVWLIYKQERGIELPRHGGVPANARIAVGRLMREGCRQSMWTRVESTWECFDVILMAAFEDIPDREARYPGHVGLAVSRSLILHVGGDGKGSSARCVERSDARIAGRIISAHRYAAA